jgi:hypothetical protein
VNPSAQERILSAFLIAAGLIAIGFGGLPLWIAGGAVLTLALLKVLTS